MALHRTDGSVTYAPRTFSYCPVISSASFERGFAACARLGTTNYSDASGVDPASLGSSQWGNFTTGSVSWNYTARLAVRSNSSTACGPGLHPLSPMESQGLSCVQQVRLSPYMLPGGVDDSFFQCNLGAERRSEWPGTPNWGEPIAVIILISIFFLIPIVSVIWLVTRRGPRAVAPKLARAPSSGRSSSAGDFFSEHTVAHESVREESRREESRRSGDDQVEAQGGEAGRVHLSFEDVYYSVTLNASAKKAVLEAAKAKGQAASDMPPFWDTKVIIKGVSGAFGPGSLSAIMGPSGCGKSTLLNVLADRMRVGNASGAVLLNGHPRGKCFKRACGYVMQSDALFANLTVREMLSFTAELRVVGNDAREKGERVARVIRELDLGRVADSRIGGGSVRGISGGQARRCTVGVELVTQPSVLFLDEPTTGLDAYSSLLLCRSLRALADSGRTVLCTIHQPRPDIFALFDTLVLMSSGEMAYFGERAAIGPYLGGVGISIPDDVNPADFVVDLTYARDEARVVDELVSRWRTSAAGSQMGNLVRRLGDGSFPGLGTELRRVEDVYEAAAARAGGSKRSTVGGAGGASGSAFARPLIWQIYSLMRRAYTNTLRSPDFVRRVLGFPMLNYLFFGLLYLGTRTPRDPAAGFTEADAELESFSALISQKRSFYFQVMATAILTESSVMGEAFDEQRAFRREHASGAYSILAYHVQWLLRLNFRAIYKSILFSCVVYFFPAHAPNNFGNGGLFLTFLFFLVVMCVCSTVGSALALLFISLIPDAEGAAGAHNAIAAVLLQYSGFYLLPCLMPPLVNTAYFLSFGKYALEAMLANEFATVPYGTQWNLFNSVQQSLDPTLSRWSNVAILMLYPFAFHILAMLSSLLQTRPKSFWAPLEDWLHARMPSRFPQRDVLARAGAPPGPLVPPAADVKEPA